MRLTCPNCRAQYEVPDEVIPEEGRDVQCSNCERTWFQEKTPAETPEPVAAEPKEEETQEEETVVAAEVTIEEPMVSEKDAVAEPETFKEQPAAATGAAAPKGNVDPAVADILREEAQREAELRAREAENIESQPDLGLETHVETKPEPETPPATETASEAERKDVLPDVDAINSTLRSDLTSETEEEAQPAPRKSGGFMRGFAVVLIVAIILFLIYGNAQQISNAVPQADPVLTSYVSLVDQARIWLEAQVSAVAPQN